MSYHPRFIGLLAVICGYNPRMRFSICSKQAMKYPPRRIYAMHMRDSFLATYRSCGRRKHTSVNCRKALCCCVALETVELKMDGYLRKRYPSS